MGPDIYPIATIGSGSLSIMAKPVAGEWIEDELSGIAKSGIKRIVSLLEYTEAIELGLETEKDLSEKYGMEFISYPIADRGVPNSVSEYLEFTKCQYRDIAKGVNSLIHCRAGIGRSGLIAAGILLHCGFEANAAFAHISTKRRVSVPCDCVFVFEV